jgi:predicted nucleic acid-binding protein
MSVARAFFDTNVLIYTRDRSDPRKQQIAESIYRNHLAGRNIYISTQILQEFYVTLSRKISGVSLDDAYALTFELSQLHVVTIGPRDVLDAIASQRYQLSFWDSMVLTTAQKAGATLLYSEDFNHGQQFGTVRIENPFIK